MALNFKPIHRPADVQILGNSGVLQHGRRVMDAAAPWRQKLNQLTQWVWLSCGIIETLIVLRIVMKFMAVDPTSTFAELVYGVTSLFVAPFAAFTVNPAYGGITLELTSMMAMIVYALLAWLASQALLVVFHRIYNHTRHETIYRQTY
jgi:uncharacterized protein YggT (Ycf19 family)